MKKHAFGMAAALALVLGAGVAHAAGKVGIDSLVRVDAQRVGVLATDQGSLDCVAAWTDGVHDGPRNVSDGMLVRTATKQPPFRFP